MSSCAPDKKFCCHILLYSCFIKLFYRILMVFICCLNLPHIERQPQLTYHQYYKVIGCLSVWNLSPTKGLYRFAYFFFIVRGRLLAKKILIQIFWKSEQTLFYRDYLANFYEIFRKFSLRSKYSCRKKIPWFWIFQIHF